MALALEAVDRAVYLLRRSKKILANSSPKGHPGILIKGADWAHVVAAATKWKPPVAKSGPSPCDPASPPPTSWTTPRVRRNGVFFFFLPIRSTG